MSLKDFINQPNEACKMVLSIGAPGSGKSSIMLNVLKHYWLPGDYFNEYHLILPTYKYEQKNSYSFLDTFYKKDKKKIFIYDKYHPLISEKILNQQKKNNNNKIFFSIDDSTHLKGDLFYSGNIIELATTSRHLNIHSWLIMHYNKTIIPPNVRQNIEMLFIHRLKLKSLEDIYDNHFEYRDKQEFESKRGFVNYVAKQYIKNKYYTIYNDEIRNTYNEHVCKWFKHDK